MRATLYARNACIKDTISFGFKFLLAEKVIRDLLKSDQNKSELIDKHSKTCRLINVPVKLKLQHPPRHLTVILARGGGNLNTALRGWGI